MKKLNKLGTFPTKPIEGRYLSKKGATKNIELKSKKASAYADYFSDPMWKYQWYEHDYRTSYGPVMDLNVVPVYDMRITGKGIYVAVVDNGVKKDTRDLENNFESSLSFDTCRNKEGSEPVSLTPLFSSSHGTKSASVIAMEANNNFCGVGIAHNAKIIGVRAVCRTGTSLHESKGLTHKLDVVDIYSNSWGFSDDGLTMEASRLHDIALTKGITEGREKKGAIYVFATGNGKAEYDVCGADGLVNHVATIPIASASQTGQTTYYSERCTGIFATTYSGNTITTERVVSINGDGECTTDFTGTSASAPLASGIIALALEANSKLTYRDVMHLITMTAEVAPLANNENSWYKNNRGFWVSNDFGFGLLNAENLVTMAQTWVNVPKEKYVCSVTVEPVEKIFNSVHVAIVEIETSACQDSDENPVFFLEHLELVSDIEYPVRGYITIKLKSPEGTTSKVLEQRKNDKNEEGLQQWSIKTLHNWGEDPKGKWTVLVKAEIRSQDKTEPGGGYVKKITLKFHGTKEEPDHYKKGMRKYSAFRLPDGSTQT